MRILIKNEEVASKVPVVQGFALWEIGFRPFYLFASIYAAVSVLLWSAQFSGWLHYPLFSGSIWHAHEMLFGFVLPVIVGFLLTAGQSWTGRRTLSGLPLMGLTLLWFVARILVFTPWYWLAAIANTAFPLVAAAALAVPFFQAGVRRNYFFLLLLVAMSAVIFGVHASRLGIPYLAKLLSLQQALDIVLFILVVMAGRIIPPFTKNGVPGAQPRRLDWLERLAPALVLVILAADLVKLEGTLLALILLFAFIAQAWRLLLWDSLKALGTPLVWVLHFGYAWIVLHLALRTLAEFALISSSVATHALTTGAVGTLTLGMMTRTAKAHTGRPLKADRFDVSCYLLVAASALVRVFTPLMVPSWLLVSTVISAVLWSFAFAIFAVRYWPVLTCSRVDGKPG